LILGLQIRKGHQYTLKSIFY